jgi:hypothetical protein
MSLQVTTRPKNKELFDKILEKGEVARAGDIEQYCTVPVTDPKKAFGGPVTEFYGTYFWSFKLLTALTLLGSGIPQGS